MLNSSRIVGLDAARAFAIIGMIIVHMASLVWTTKVVLDDIPSAMFAIIAGTTMMLIAQNYTFTTFLKLNVRGALVALMGIALLQVGGEIQIVLVVMGITMIITSWIPALNTEWRLALFIGCTIVSTIYYANEIFPPVYPIITWVAYFIGGMLLYDVYIKNLQNEQYNINSRLIWSFTGVALLVSIIGFCLRFVTDIPVWLRFTGHSGALGEIILSMAVTAVVFQMCLLLGVKTRQALVPLAAMGSMSMTTYVLHVLTACYWQGSVVAFSTISAFSFILLFLALATFWYRFVGQGPLEVAVKRAIHFIVQEQKK